MPIAACFLVFEKDAVRSSVGKAGGRGVRENAREIPALTLNPVGTLSQHE